MPIQPIGFIKLHRELASEPIWTKSNPEQKVVLVTLLMMANFKKKNWLWDGCQFEAQPGQFVTSLESIAKNCGTGVNIQSVRSSLKKFEKLGFLTNESTKTGRLITIANWSLYSGEFKEPTDQPTKSQQRANKEPTNKPTPREEGREGEEGKKKEKTFLSDSAEIRLSEHLFSRMKINNPTAKVPNWQVWARNIDLMMRVDNRTEDDIVKVIDWCQKDNFWKGNILSTAKLREKYDQLHVRMNQDEPQKPKIDRSRRIS